MKVEKLSLEKSNGFSQFFLDYKSEKDELKAFYNRPPKIEHFKEQIEGKQFDQQKRTVLFESLSNQYKGFTISKAVNANLESLKEDNTFTITTGHQLNIFTGPLYFIYKIVTVINTTLQLKAQYPDYKFVPVYWMASEDHDFDEIKYFNLFGKKHVWDSDQKGAVGKFDPKSMSSIIDALPEKNILFEKAYLEQDTLADACRYYVNELFGDKGLIIIDGDDKGLKGQFTKVMHDDLFNHHANDLVEQSSSKISELGYKPQVYPRTINFFYLKGDIRARIIKEDNGWKVNKTDLLFSEAELEEMIQKEPEVFSPNVILRPLYQEQILPNLAYVGGPGELVYWLQLKSTFDYYKVPFPILMPRNFALVINKSFNKKIKKFDFSMEEVFMKTEHLLENHIKKNADHEISFTSEKENLQTMFDGITEQSKLIDGSLQGFIGAEYNKALKSIDTIEKRLKKSEQSKHEVALNQITAFKEKLFPNGGLQERHDNFLNFYLNNPEFINQLYQVLDPFDFSMHILLDD